MDGKGSTKSRGLIRWRIQVFRSFFKTMHLHFMHSSVCIFDNFNKVNEIELYVLLQKELQKY